MITDTIKSWFAWKTVQDTGCHLYQVNQVTGKRRVQPMLQAGCGYQPIDKGWVETGEWTPRPRPPMPYGTKGC